MSQKDKLIQRLLSNPKDFASSELIAFTVKSKSFPTAQFYFTRVIPRQSFKLTLKRLLISTLNYAKKEGQSRRIMLRYSL